MAKIIKNSLGNFLVTLLIFSLVTGWIFSGWPQIWEEPPIPPEVQEVEAAAIAVVYGEQTTEQTHTGDDLWKDALTVAAASWTANATYLLLCTAQIGGDTIKDLFAFRLTYGGTQFTGSLTVLEPYSATATERQTYGYMTKYTVPATAVDVVFQMNTADATGSTVWADSIVILGIRLDADLVETDYKYNENTSFTTYTTSPVDFATITFTPGNTGDDWLVIAASTHLVNGVAAQTGHRIRRDGTEASPTEAVPMWSEEGENAAEEKSNLLMRVYNLDDTSHTFAVQGWDNDAEDEHYRSAIIALRLDAFEDHNNNWNEAEHTPTGTTYEELADISFTPQTAGDFILMGFAVCDSGDYGDYCGIRTQVDGATKPTEKDLNWDTTTNDDTGEPPMLTLAKVNFAASLRDIDFDGAVSDTNTARIEDRSVVAFSLELAPPVTTIGDGTNPGNSTIAPETAITDLDAFTFVTTSGTDSITPATVTLAAGTAAGLSEIRITSDDGITLYFSVVSNPASDTVNFSGGTAIPVTTSPTQFKVRITPKIHANMSAPPGSEYAVTGTVTSFTSDNSQEGSDSASATITIDNLSPNGATVTSGSEGNTQVTLNWTTSASSDFSRSVILRWAAETPGSEVPAEGTDYSVDNTITTATVACVRTADADSTAVSGTDGAGTGGCSAVALTNGQAYSYKVFQKDSNGNYDVGVTFTGSPFTPAAAPTLSFSISDTSVGFGTLSTSAPRFATGTDGSGSETSAHDLDVSISNASGYSITVKGATLTFNSYTIDVIGGAATDVTAWGGTEQFGIRLTVSGGGSVVAPYNGVSNMYAYAANATTEDQVASFSGASDTSTFSVFYATNISTSTEAGIYTATLTYICTGIF